MWLIPACCELVKETGDTSFLQKKLPFQDGGEAGVYEHLKRAMQYMINDAGAHGIPRIRYADWNRRAEYRRSGGGIRLYGHGNGVGM